MTDLLLLESHLDVRLRVRQEFENEFKWIPKLRLSPSETDVFSFILSRWKLRAVLLLLLLFCVLGAFLSVCRSWRWCNRSCLFRGRRGGVIQPRCTPCDCDKKTQSGGGPVHPSPDPRCTVREQLSGLVSSSEFTYRCLGFFSCSFFSC